jgi:hypothetical protein
MPVEGVRSAPLASTLTAQSNKQLDVNSVIWGNWSSVKIIHWRPRNRAKRRRSIGVYGAKKASSSAYGARPHLRAVNPPPELAPITLISIGREVWRTDQPLHRADVELLVGQHLSTRTCSIVFSSFGTEVQSLASFIPALGKTMLPCKALSRQIWTVHDGFVTITWILHGCRSQQIREPQPIDMTTSFIS